VPAVTTIEFTVRYSESDQMGLAYHANYLAWCDMARTEYLRACGLSYRDLEAGGLLLAVVDARVRYRSPARFDDRLRVRCWLRSVTSRGVEFGYEMVQAADGRTVATARTSLIALDASHALSRISPSIRAALVPTPDPVRV
jgi:acyl-CoA thioester hydrolase